MRGDLRLYQAALLAGLPQAPSEYNPFRNPEAALARRNEVLRKMVENGYITQAEATRASQRGLGLKHGTRYIQRREPYFFDYVQEKLIERYGVGVVRRGGLRIHTTIDPKMQDQARERRSTPYYADPAGPSSAIVAIDPANGKIRAMASSGTLPRRNFNLAAQGHRQPGSAFKTFVLTAAIRKGVDPDSTYYTSKPLDIDDPTYGHWEVKTFGNSYIGTVSLTRATLSSDNTVYAQLILDIGPKAVCETAKLLGITTKLDCYPAEGLGGLTLGVTPLEMAGAYATLASGGVRHRPTGIEKVVFPDGKSENLANSKGKRVLTDGEAYEVTKVLKMNVQSRHRHRGQLRLPGGRQDGDHRRGEGRLVRGIHAQAVRGGLGRVSEGGHRDAGRAGRHIRRARLARVHGARPRRPTATTSRRRQSRPSCRRTSASTPGPAPPARARTPRRATGGTTTQPDQKYDPRFYEQAPLDQPNQTPPEQVQPEQPAPGNNGNGNGNGNPAPG